MSNNESHYKKETETLKELRENDRHNKLNVAELVISGLNKGEIKELVKRNPGLMNFLKNAIE